MNTTFSTYLNIAQHLIRFILLFSSLFLMLIGLFVVLIPLLSGGFYQVIQSLSRLSSTELATFLDQNLQNIFWLTLMLLFIQKGLAFLFISKVKLSSIEVQSK